MFQWTTTKGIPIKHNGSVVFLNLIIITAFYCFVEKASFAFFWDS